MNALDYLQIQIWSLCTVFFFFKILALSLIQGQARWKTRNFAAPEDSKLLAAMSVKHSADPALKERVERAGSAVRNDIENVLIFLLLMWAYLVIGADTRFYAIYVGIFVIARTLHSVAYLKKIQPLRTIAFNVGVLTSGLVAVTIVWRVIKAWSVAL